MKYFICLVFIIFLTAPFSVLAVETVKSPLVNEGDLQLEHKGKYQYDSNPKRDDEKEYDLAVSYGLTSRWKTRLESEFEDKRDGGLNYKNINWENIVSLTGNESALPIAFYLDVLASDRSNTSHSALMGMIMLKKIGATVNTVNLFLRREFGDTASNKTSFVYRFQSRYHLYSYLDPGFELWGDTNKKDAFRDQTLKIGPGIFGKFAVGTAPNFGYEVVYLFGATQASHDGTLMWRLTYDFP